MSKLWNYFHIIGNWYKSQLHNNNCASETYTRISGRDIWVHFSFLSQLGLPDEPGRLPDKMHDGVATSYTAQKVLGHSLLCGLHGNHQIWNAIFRQPNNVAWCRPRWASCWPHESCYQGHFSNNSYQHQLVSWRYKRFNPNQTWLWQAGDTENFQCRISHGPYHWLELSKRGINGMDH